MKIKHSPTNDEFLIRMKLKLFSDKMIIPYLKLILYCRLFRRRPTDETGSYVPSISMINELFLSVVHYHAIINNDNNIIAVDD